MITGVKFQGFEDLKPEVEDLYYPRQLFITCFVFHREKTPPPYTRNRFNWEVILGIPQPIKTLSSLVSASLSE